MKIRVKIRDNIKTLYIITKPKNGDYNFSSDVSFGVISSSGAGQL